MYLVDPRITTDPHDLYIYYIFFFWGGGGGGGQLHRSHYSLLVFLVCMAPNILCNRITSSSWVYNTCRHGAT